MERRVLLAVALSFLVLVVYQQLLGPPPAPVDPVAVDGPTVPAPGGEPARAAAPPVGASRARGGTPLPAESEAEAAPFEVLVADERARDIVVESDLVRAVFTNRGAKLVSWQLKRYEGEDGRPVELIPPEVEPGAPWPFTLMVPADPVVSARLDEALFRPSAAQLRVAANPATLEFVYEDSSGLRARKSFTFQRTPEQPYVVAFQAEVTTAAGAQPVMLRWGPALGGVRPQTSRMMVRQLPAAVLYGRAFENDLLADVDLYRVQSGDVAERPTYDGQFDFAGVDNQYFLAAALPSVERTHVDYHVVSAVGLEHDLVAFDVSLAADAGAIPVFLGPKDFDVLQAVHPDLVRAIDFGWLSGLVVPLHRTLKWIYGYLGNYGWSIILLTVLINVLIFPLRHKSVVSMRKMQELQPEMKAIQARYANLKATDPAKQKMNQEVMELYRRNGANPASGCLPMLLTMPILFAFYRLLSMAIEIRGAPFVGWITDLSMHDPLYITPVVMGATMVLQQRLQPAGADPTQQKIMMLMPVMFTFMFLWAPSGLVIYWLTSNVIGIGQQLLTNRIAGPPRLRHVRPPAERMVKKAAGGATSAQEAETLEAEVTEAVTGAAESGPAAARTAGRAGRSGKGSRRSRGRGR